GRKGKEPERAPVEVPVEVIGLGTSREASPTATGTTQTGASRHVPGLKPGATSQAAILPRGTAADVLRILLRQGADLVAEFEKQFFPPSRLRGRIAIKTLGIRHPARSVLHQLLHQARDLLASCELREQVA